MAEVAPAHEHESAASSSSSSSSKVPSSITRVYNVPVVKDTVIYADSVLRSYSLSAAFYSRAEAVATTLYKRAGEPIQDRLQGQINQLDGLANKGLDYVQGKAPYIFDAKTDEILSTARKPADQAYTTAKSYQDHALNTAKSVQSNAFNTAKVYQDAVYTRLHETLVNSQATLGGLQERLGTAAAKVPKSTQEAQQAATHVLEQLEAIKSVLVKQSQGLPSHLSKAVEPYIAKLQKGATDVKEELSKKDVPLHLRAQHIIGITREITSEVLHEAMISLKSVADTIAAKSEATANGHANGNGNIAEQSEKFVEEHTPGDHTYAEAVQH